EKPCDSSFRPQGFCPPRTPAPRLPTETWTRVSGAGRGHAVTDESGRAGRPLYAWRAVVKIPTIASSSPDATTIAAPVGRSILYDAHNPMMLDAAAIPHPIVSRFIQSVASMVPQTAGTIKYANVSSTPPSRTKLTTTSAKAA